MEKVSMENEQESEIIARRESEEVEDIESSDDESKVSHTFSEKLDDKSEVLDKKTEKIVEENFDSPQKNGFDDSNTFSEKRGKELDIEGELDYEEEAPVKEDESDGENDNEDDEIEAVNKLQEKEEGEEDGEDDGEISEDDLEEGEVKDASSSRRNTQKSLCRFFHKGQCTWGLACRFIHPGVNDKGNYNMFGSQPVGSSNTEQVYSFTEVERYVPPPPAPVPNEEGPPPPESAWERGLRHAKEIIKKSIKRKETEPDFEDKRMNMSLVESELQAEYEKEADYYAAHSRHRSENETYYHPGNYDRRMYSGQWHHRPQEYDLAWPHPVPEYDYRDYRDRNRHYPVYDRDIREPKESRDRVDHRNAERWRDDRYSQAQSNRATRADEWRDPWRRSKSPKGPRRSRSKNRSRHSYSSASSASYSSSRSSRSSSYSYSKSRSSSRSSRSRSFSLSSVRSKSRSPVKGKSGNKIPMRTVPNRRNSTLNRNANAAVNKRNKVKSPAPSSIPQKQKSYQHIGSQPSTGRRKMVQSGVKNTKRGRSPSWSRSISSRSQSPNQPVIRSKSRSFSRSLSRSLSISSVSSVSSSAGSLSPNEHPSWKKGYAQEKNKAKISNRPNKDSSRQRKSIDDSSKLSQKASKDPLKPSSGVKPQIKLTLLKPSGDKTANIAKRKTIDEMLAEKQKLDKDKSSQKTAKKRPASSPIDSSAKSVPSKKSTSSRREELLKQLRAVEDAIARKRTKF